MTDFDKVRAELKAHYHAAAKAAHPDMGGSAEQMAEVNAAYEQIMKEVDRREQEERAQTQAQQPKARSKGSWKDQFSPVHDDPPPPKEYAGTTKGRVHRVYDEQGLSAAIALARSLGIKPKRFKRWHEDFKFSAEWE